MKKTIYLITTLLLSLSLSTKVEAYCTQEEINEFKKIENQFEVTYKYDENTGIYTIWYTSPRIDKYVFDKLIESQDESDICVPEDYNTIKCTGKNIKTPLEYKIKGNTSTCNDILKTATIDLKTNPNYNKYSESPLCNGIEDFVLCQEDYKGEISQEEFENRIGIYKESLEKENNQNDNKEDNDNNIKEEKTNIINSIIEYIKNNTITILIILIFIILVIATLIIETRKIRKSRRLE